MANTNTDSSIIDAAILSIINAGEPESVTNIVVGGILDYLNTKTKEFDSQLNANPTDSIESLRDVKNFLAGISDRQTLLELLINLQRIIEDGCGTQIEKISERVDVLAPALSTLKTDMGNDISRAKTEAVNEAKLSLLVDIVTSLGVQYRPDINPEEPFLINGIYVGYDEMVRVYAHRQSWPAPEPIDYDGIRTNLLLDQPTVTLDSPPDVKAMFRSNSVVVAKIADAVYGLRPKTMTYIFAGGSKNLREVIGPLNLSLLKTGTLNPFSSNNSSQIYPKLETVWIKGLSTHINLFMCKAISAECYRYMIENAANTSPINVYVHPDVYAKLTDGVDEEWSMILLEALERNINFVSRDF